MKLPILILHGWMVKPNRYQKIEELLRQHGYRVYVPDMPGFGKVPLVKNPMGVSDYVDWIVDFLKKNKLKKVNVIGHSFGGRVGVKLAVLHPDLVEKLILTGAPLIKVPLSLKKRVLSSVAKTGKKAMQILPRAFQKFFRKAIYRLIGEYDYYKAGSMQKTFLAINNEDLSDFLAKVSVPTSIIWGVKDTFVPLVVGKAIAEKIPNATLTLIKETGHRLPYENPLAFAQTVLSFLS